MNLRTMMTNVRIRCADPLSQAPADRTLLLMLSTQVQRFTNKTALSGKPWAVDELTLTATPNTENYPLPIDSHFGKPLQVRTVHSGNSSHIERDIPFFELGEVNFNWPLPKSYSGSYSFDGSPHTAQRMAFFRKGGTDQVYVRVQPIPRQSSTYQILYQIGVYGETTPLDETPFLPEHHALIEIRTAIALLPHCKWSDDDRANSDKRKELAMALVADSTDLERDFLRYIATTSASTQPVYRELPFGID